MTMAFWATFSAIGSGIAALVAAGFWFYSAAMRLPPVTARLYRDDVPLGPTPREQAEVRQSAFSAVAATFAGIAALLQVAASMLTP